MPCGVEAVDERLTARAAAARRHLIRHGKSLGVDYDKRPGPAFEKLSGAIKTAEDEIGIPIEDAETAVEHDGNVAARWNSEDVEFCSVAFGEDKGIADDVISLVGAEHPKRYRLLGKVCGLSCAASWQCPRSNG